MTQARLCAVGQLLIERTSKYIVTKIRQELIDITLANHLIATVMNWHVSEKSQCLITYLLTWKRLSQEGSF